MKKLVIIFSIFLSFGLQMEGQTSKVSSFVRKVLMENKATTRRLSAASGNGSQAKLDNRKMAVLIQSDDEEALKENGCRILAQWDDIYAVEVSISKLSQLAKNEHITRIEAGEPCNVTLDTTRTKVNADAMHSCPRTDQDLLGYTGRGVIVGVQDIGFDLTHPTFRTSDGNHLRIKAMWDQLSKDTVNSKLYVGRDYTTEEELLKIKKTADGLLQTHGSHTSGIAAGNGHEDYVSIGGTDIISPYIGLAPEADIVLSANYTGDNYKSVTDSIRYKYTTATDLLGFKYIFDYADSVGKPCVINFSEGAHDDLYEHGLYEKVIAKMLGPGHILCSAAGNEAYKPSCVHKPLGKQQAGAFLTCGSYQAIYTMASIKPVELKLNFYSKDTTNVEWNYNCEGLKDYPDSLFTDTLEIGNFTYAIYLMTYPSCNDSTIYATDFFIQELGAKSTCWSSVPVSLTLLGEDNDIEVYNCGGYFKSDNNDPDLKDFTYDHNILFPASCEDVICVGGTAWVTGHYNYNEKYMYSNCGVNGERMSYSSMGPTLAGLTKPDVSAPGMNVVSAYNNYYVENNPNAGDLSWTVRNFKFKRRTYSWTSNSGTSMACPVVTGIVACWLELCPTLSPDQLKDIFAHSCTHTDETIEYPNNQYGWGQIDAMAGIEYIQKTYTGIEDVKEKSIFYNLYLSHVFDINGIKHNNIEGKKGIFIVRKGNRMVKIMK